MRVPTLKGIIRRRILVNFRAEPRVVQNLLPNGFRPKLHKDTAIVGVCLIRLEHIRPKFAPSFIGINSENAAHRIAVEWEVDGVSYEGVFVPRRDTDSSLNVFVGGTLFPGEHNKADFVVVEDDLGIDLSMASKDHAVKIDLKGTFADKLPADSIFSDLGESSAFFEKGSLGYSATKGEDHLDGLTLETKTWEVKPLQLNSVSSSFFDDRSVFPEGTIQFDHALIMKNIEHEWHSAPNYELK